MLVFMEITVYMTKYFCSYTFFCENSLYEINVF